LFIFNVFLSEWLEEFATRFVTCTITFSFNDVASFTVENERHNIPYISHPPTHPQYM
jgi:hypothetical protein